MENNSARLLAFAFVAFLATFIVPMSARAVALIEDSWVELVAKTDRGDSIHAVSDGEKLTRLSLAFGGDEFCVDVTPFAELEGPYIQSLQLLVDRKNDAGELTRKVAIPFYSWKGARRNGLLLVLALSESQLIEAHVAANNDFDDVIYVFPMKPRLKGTEEINPSWDD
jgi:hypothetical protein